MFIKIPFESIIDFKTNISEITKMSLEHDFNVNEGAILGNFYISGEYRVHEVSINRELFNYTLPFTVELRDDIKRDTVEFNIEDFSYDVVNNKSLKVNIEYSLKAEIEDEALFKRVDEDELESELAFIDSFLDEENKNMGSEIIEEVEEVEEEKEIICEEILEKKLEVDDRKKKNDIIEKENKNDVKKLEETEIGEEERITKEEEKTIMDTIKASDDTFVTYHIHIVKESETLESISSLYKVSNSLINEYNDLENISMGDKILIPQIDE